MRYCAEILPGRMRILFALPSCLIESLKFFPLCGIKSEFLFLPQRIDNLFIIPFCFSVPLNPGVIVIACSTACVLLFGIKLLLYFGLVTEERFFFCKSLFQHLVLSTFLCGVVTILERKRGEGGWAREVHFRRANKKELTIQQAFQLKNLLFQFPYSSLKHIYFVFISLCRLPCMRFSINYNDQRECTDPSLGLLLFTCKPRQSFPCFKQLCSQ